MQGLGPEIEFPAFRGRKYPGFRPGIPVRDCGWFYLNHHARM